MSSKAESFGTADKSCSRGVKGPNGVALVFPTSVDVAGEVVVARSEREPQRPRYEPEGRVHDDARPRDVEDEEEEEGGEGGRGGSKRPAGRLEDVGDPRDRPEKPPTPEPPTPSEDSVQIGDSGANAADMDEVDVDGGGPWLLSGRWYIAATADDARLEKSGDETGVEEEPCSVEVEEYNEKGRPDNPIDCMPGKPGSCCTLALMSSIAVSNASLQPASRP